MINDRITELIIKYESEGLGEEETIELFQHLVDTGMAWSLQGFYGRQAMALIEMGLVTRPTEPKATKVIKENKKKPKLKRGRRSTKQVGAMVEMAQRRTKGQGIILERVEDVPYSGHEDYPTILNHMKANGTVGHGVIESEHHNFVLVQWFAKPSDYTMERSHYTRQWYPDKWVKVISPAHQKKKDN